MNYKLRWYFEYLGRNPYYGVWGYADPARPAWCRNYEGLIKVIIQGKDQSGKVTNLAECSGQDYMNMSWMAEAKYRPQGRVGNSTLPTRIIGLMMATSKGNIKVYIDGTVLTDDVVYDFNFSTYGR